MPSTVEAVLIVFFALSPGIPGDGIYRVLVGADWRQKDWQAFIRLVLFSALGLGLYSIFVRVYGWPAPTYISPESFKSGGSINPASLHLLFLPYMGHLGGSALAGLAVGAGFRVLVRLYPFRAPYASAWDQFMRVYLRVPGRQGGRWVLVTLSNGGVYIGRITSADLSVPSGERDIVLTEPAQYDEDKTQYIALPYQHIFLPAALISQIAILYNPDIDTDRRTEVGGPIYENETGDEHTKTGAATADKTGV